MRKYGVRIAVAALLIVVLAVVLILASRALILAIRVAVEGGNAVIPGEAGEYALPEMETPAPRPSYLDQDSAYDHLWSDGQDDSE